MDRVLRSRLANQKQKTGNKSADVCLEKKSGRGRVLAEKTNDNIYMEPQSKRRLSCQSVFAKKDSLLRSGKKETPCVYKCGGTAGNQELRPEERLALYTFEVDESEPRPKKAKRKRKARQKIKLDMSDTTDEDVSLIVVKKQLRSAVRFADHLDRETSNHDKENIHKHMKTGPDPVNFQKKHNVSEVVTSNKHEKDNCKTINCSSSVTENKDVSITGSGYQIDSFHDESVTVMAEKREKTAVENRIHKSDSTFQMQHNQEKTTLKNNENISMKDITPYRKPEICTSLAEDSELNFSMGESEPGHVSSSCSNLTFSPIQEQRGAFVTVRRPSKIKHIPIQIAEEFTIENCFGFDEESEDDLLLSLSPVNMVSASKATSFVPFAMSSTPNLKTTTTQTLSHPTRLPRSVLHPVLKAIRASTFKSTVISQAVPTVESVTTSETISAVLPQPVSPVEAITSQGPSTESTITSVSVPTVECRLSEECTNTNNAAVPGLFVDENTQQFTKPPRKSYERPVRLHFESKSEWESASDDEGSNKKRIKRSKKSKKEEKIVAKWAANVSAQFDEIESFELCVE